MAGAQMAHRTQFTTSLISPTYCAPAGWRIAPLTWNSAKCPHMHQSPPMCAASFCVDAPDCFYFFLRALVFRLAGARGGVMTL
jgi:hypothetical protein